MLSIFTVSRQDLYDYLRCPKIVASKTYRNSVKPAPRPTRRPERSLIHEIGAIGETVTQRTFSAGAPEEAMSGLGQGVGPEEIGEPGRAERGGAALESPVMSKGQILSAIKSDLRNRGVQLDSQMNAIMRETMAGLEKIKRRIHDEYGPVRIIGRGESHNGLLPHRVRPDFVAMVGDRKKPILIEVKNTERPSPRTDRFQASFYNTVGRRFGVTVMGEHRESGRRMIVPKTIGKKISETLLVYPRQGKAERITDEVEIDSRIVAEIWRAKQLGIRGRSPKTDCGSSCPHHRHGTLPEGNMEASIPMPLIYSKGRIEQGEDLDIGYLGRFLLRSGIREIIRNGLTDIRYAGIPRGFGDYDQERRQKIREALAKQKDRYVADVAKRLGFGKDVMERLVSHEYRDHEEEGKELEREMAGELEPWKKLLGSRKFKLARGAAKSTATQIYSLPNRSERFVKNSWDGWQ